MDDASSVSRIERVSDLNGERQNQLGVHGSPCNAVFQSHPVQKLHDNERLTFMLSNLMYYADIGMAERRGGLCFALETGQRLLVFGQVFGQEFQGNKAM